MEYISARFQLPEPFINKIKSLPYEFGFGGFGIAVYSRTYSRKTEKGNEEWPDTVIRVIEGTFSLMKHHYLKNKLEWEDNKYFEEAFGMAEYMMKFLFLPPGRGLWATGSEQVYKRGSACCNNCAAVQLLDLGKDIEWIMLQLSMGVGVGARLDFMGNLLGPQGTTTFVIGDNRESWAASTRALIDSYIHGKPLPLFIYDEIRDKGVELQTFGGQASGPDPLIALHKRIKIYLDTYLLYQNNDPNYWRYHFEQLYYLDYSYQNKKEFMTKCKTNKIYNQTRLCADIVNAVGCCIVAGGVRRSSEILLGYPNDDTFLNLKNKDVNPERENICWASNNSVILDKMPEDQLLNKIASLVEKNGEPGIANVVNFKKGRLNHENIGREAEIDHANVCNPCITGDSLILTKEGLKLVSELIDKQFIAIVNGEEYKSTSRGFWSTGVREVVEIVLHNEMKLKATPDHKIATMTGFKEINQLNIGELVNVTKDGMDNMIAFVKSVTVLGQEEVFDCSIEEVHCFYANGILTANCGEICLESYELCNLAEVFMPRCKNKDEFIQALKYATLYTHIISLIPTHSNESNKVIEKNRRVGVSLSGITELYDQMEKKEFIQWLEDGYKVVRTENQRLAKLAKIPESLRVTTTKPSGSISQLVGVNSGAHWPIATYAIRRMRISNHSPLVPKLKEMGYYCEKDTYADATLVFEFPIKCQGRPSHLVSLREQLELLEILQRYWSDNMVSISLYYQPERDQNNLVPLLKEFLPKVKSLSIFPLKKEGEETYAQPPYEKITEEKYYELLKKINNIQGKIVESGEDGCEPLYCTNEGCI